MTIAVECSQCGKKYRVADDRAGGTLDCKECGEEIDIPGGRRRSKSGKKKKSSGGGGSTAIIGTIVGAGVLAVGLVLFAFMRKPPEVVNPVANNPPGEQPGPAVTPVNPAPPNPNPQPNPNPAVAANPNPNNGGVTKAAGSGFKGGSDQGGVGSKFAFKSPQKWTVQPDPIPDVLTFDTTKKYDVKIKGGYISDTSVVYPETPSPFALLGESDPKPGRELWNLATGAKSKVLAGHRFTTSLVALSPDGKYVAWFKFDNGGVVEVWDVEAKKSLGGVNVEASKFNMAVLAIVSSTRMVALSDVHHGLLSWKLPSGDLEREYKIGDKASPGDLHAFSPGGRYAALLKDYLAKSIAIYDFNTGEVAGELEFVNAPTTLLGLGFSHDGQEFAMAFDGEAPSYGERIFIWKTSTGAVVDTIVLEEGVKKEHNLHGKGTSLQWFPNGKQFLLHGVAIVDRAAKKVVYSLGKPKLDSGSLKNRHVLDNGLVAAWDGTRQDSSVQPILVKAEDIAKSVAAVDAGGLMVDAKLPKLTRFDASAAPDRSDDSAAGWQVPVDPAPAAPGSLLNKPLAMKGTGKPRGLSVSSANVALAFVRFAEGEDANDLRNRSPEIRFRAGKSGVLTQYRTKPIHCQKNWIEVFDVAKGDAACRIDVDYSCDLLAASADGKRVLVGAHDGLGRVDVYSAEDGSHVAGCRPFQEEPKEPDRDIQTALFLSSDLVGVINFEDRLIVFKLPDCKPLYELKEAVSPIVSPGGKVLAVARDKKVDLRDPATGDPKGAVELGGPIRALAFHPNGQRLAAVTNEKQGSYVTEIDLKDNRNGQPIPLPMAVQSLQWCGDDYLLLNNTALFDLKQKTVAWTYELASADDTYIAAPPDGRLWLSAKSARSTAVQIAAVELPDAAAKTKLAGKTLEPKMVVQPGGSVTVMAKIAERTDRQGFQAEALGILAKAVERSGVKDVPGQPVKLAVTAEFKQGRQVPFRFTGRGVQQEVQLQEKTIEITVAYDLGGAALWKTTSTISNISFFIHVPSIEAAQKAIDDQMWDRTRGFFDALQLPAYVFSQESVYGLGTSTLSGDGAQAKGK